MAAGQRLAVDEYLVPQLGGQYTKQGHIVLEANHTALFDLAQQKLHTLRIKVPAFLQGGHAQAFLDVIRRSVRAEECGDIRGPVGLFVARNGCRRQVPCECAFEQVFLVQAAHFQPWDAGGWQTR